MPSKVWRIRGFTLVELLLTVTIVAILLAISTASYRALMEQSDTAQAKSDLKIIEASIERFYIEMLRYPNTLNEAGGIGAMLDPWGNPYQYLNITTNKNNGKVRKDHNLVPLNTDFDLYSMGEDGKSVSPLTAKSSQDDIVRANNGAYIGLASEY